MPARGYQPDDMVDAGAVSAETRENWRVALGDEAAREAEGPDLCLRPDRNRSPSAPMATLP